jgi:hypothetical protein
MWLDTWLRRKERPKPTKRQNLELLGRDCLSLGRRLEAQLNPVYAITAPKTLTLEQKAAVNSMFHTIDRHGIPTPHSLGFGGRKVCELMAVYFVVVGQLLVDGHEIEAIAEAHTLAEQISVLA